ncbi:MAG: hypothetical protein IPJ90_12970 [Anaerolineaceae bacterium]|nr:hypothetical protein [Anaerolineaceae bacterium]
MNADERGLNLGASCANLRKPVFICAAVHEIPYEKKAEHSVTRRNQAKSGKSACCFGEYGRISPAIWIGIGSEAE